MGGGGGDEVQSPNTHDTRMGQPVGHSVLVDGIVGSDELEVVGFHV